jgi:hypothetical protein
MSALVHQYCIWYNMMVAAATASLAWLVSVESAT